MGWPSGPVMTDTETVVPDVPPAARVHLSLAARPPGGRVYAPFADIYGAAPRDMPPGTAVEVWDGLAWLHGVAWVVGRDFDQDRICLEVDWASVREPPAVPEAREPPEWLVNLLALPIVAAIRVTRFLAAWASRKLAAFVASNVASFRRARCRKAGHEQGPYGIVCPRCGEMRDIGIPVQAGERR